MKGLFKLEFVATFTLALVFAVIAGILGLILWLSGYSGTQGVIFALMLSVFMVLIQWYFSPTLIKIFMGLKELREDEYPWIHKMVKDLANKAKIPMPKLYIVNNPTPNAFAFGRTQRSAGIGIHTGLLDVLEKAEVEAVLAHEIGHIKHRDMIVMTVASILPLLLYYLFIIFAPRRRDERGTPIWVFFGAMFARFLGTLLVMWLSRVREYFSDEFSARITEKPSNLISALSRISYGIKTRNVVNESDAMMRAFYISDPMSKESFEGIRSASSMSTAELEKAMQRERGMSLFEFFMTHPLTVKRIYNLKRIEKELKQ
jgi:heat shock protein HtpX